jgi:hypothetical protein
VREVEVAERVGDHRPCHLQGHIFERVDVQRRARRRHSAAASASALAAPDLRPNVLRDRAFGINRGARRRIDVHVELAGALDLLRHLPVHGSAVCRCYSRLLAQTKFLGRLVTASVLPVVVNLSLTDGPPSHPIHVRIMAAALIGGAFQ